MLLIVLITQACSAGNQIRNIPAADPPVSAETPTLAVIAKSTSTPGAPKPASLGSDTPSAAATSILSGDFWMDLPVVPVALSERVREIYQRGLQMGNNPNAFSKIGDCHSTNPYFLADYDLGTEVYQLGEYAYLQPTIDYFKNSFGRASLAAKQGMSTAGELAPLWADWKLCAKNETPLDCEIRKHRPSFAIISLGTNEAYDIKLDRSPFEGRLRRILEHAIDQGVVPILSTKADNDEGDHYINYVTSKLALEYELPLWNFWKAVQPLPKQGMRSADHLTFAPTKSYTDFSRPEYLKYGMQVRNLTALQVLDLIRREITQSGPAVAGTPTAVLISTEALVHHAGEVLGSSADGMKLFYVPAGEFLMGSTQGNPDSAPLHTVMLDGFWLDGNEVTNAMYANFLNIVGNKIEGGSEWLDARPQAAQIFAEGSGWQVQPGRENHPITGVSWYGAKAYCEWSGRRLPTEAEWEYAARGTDERQYPWGNDNLTCTQAHYFGCGEGTIAAGGLPSGVSPFGIFDMAGNVAEWVTDRYASDYYQSSPLQNPTGPANGYYRVIRGGSWLNTYLAIRTTHRAWAGADEHAAAVGFRCALTP
jgi:formylglycine-generating enzyme required for sulfatase activity